MSVLKTVGLVNLEGLSTHSSQVCQNYGGVSAVRLLELEIIRQETKPNSNDFFPGKMALP